MKHNYISAAVVDIAFKIHQQLGPGLFESVYLTILAHELTLAGFYVQTQVTIPVIWKEQKLEHGFRADLIVEKKVIVEVKSIEGIAAVHKKQLITYLKLSGKQLGLLINFNEALIKDGITRIVNGL